MALSSYDPNVAPDPQEWLALDEGERIMLCGVHHRSPSCDHPLAPNPRLHAAIHNIVENQIALGDETPVAENVDRLVRDGLSRHDAVHAIGSLLTESLSATLRSEATSFDTDKYYAAMRALDAHAWRESAGMQTTELSLDEIIAELHTPFAEIPRDALRAAQLKPEGIVDALTDLLRSTRKDLDEGQPPADVAHLLALMLLASYEDPIAFDAVADFCALDRKACDELLGDFTVTDLPRVFAALCGGDTARLERIVESQTRDEYIRSAALQAFVVLVAQGRIARETAIAYFEVLLRRRLQRVPSAVWIQLATNILDLHATELFDDLRRRLADGLFPDLLITEQALAEAESRSLDDALTRLAEDPDLEPVRDVISEAESWPYFDAGEFDEDFDADVDDEEDDFDFEEPQEPYVRLTPKVGRNDPCPCGSGKKYKKCCLARD